MKVLYVESAKATWLFDLRLLNPTGLSVTRLLSAVAERYRFAKAPTSPLDINEGGVKFVEGVFGTSTGVDVGVSLSVYGDGLVADSFSNTDNTIEFLRDIASLSSELGFPFPDENQIGKAFTSLLGVSCDVTLSQWFSTFDPIARTIERNVVTMDGKPRSFAFSGISIHSEDVGQNKAPTPFKFERKWGAPFSDNRYLTQAPLETNKHIALLQELETVLKG